VSSCCTRALTFENVCQGRKFSDDMLFNITGENVTTIHTLVPAADMPNHGVSVYTDRQTDTRTRTHTHTHTHTVHTLVPAADMPNPCACVCTHSLSLSLSLTHTHTHLHTHTQALAPSKPDPRQTELSYSSLLATTVFFFKSTLYCPYVYIYIYIYIYISCLMKSTAYILKSTRDGGFSGSLLLM
jgi:hypothetical protein